MKRLLWITYTICFLLTSVGVLYNTHTCGRKISGSVWGISLNPSNACTCSHDNVGHEKSCCHSSTQWLKADTDNAKLMTMKWIPRQAALPLLACEQTIGLYDPTLCRLTPAHSHSPPLVFEPRYIVFRSLLI